MPSNKIPEHNVYWKELLLRLFVVYVYMHLTVVDKYLWDFQVPAKDFGRCGRNIRLSARDKV